VYLQAKKFILVSYLRVEMDTFLTLRRANKLAEIAPMMGLKIDFAKQT